jgi:hypothetical protein
MGVGEVRVRVVGEWVRVRVKRKPSPETSSKY